MTRTTFFFKYTATTEIYTLSLHDALPIYRGRRRTGNGVRVRRRHFRHAGHGRSGDYGATGRRRGRIGRSRDRKSTRLNSSHSSISYAVFCLKKKNHTKTITMSSVYSVSTD